MTQTTKSGVKLLPMIDQNKYIEFKDKSNLGKWFTYTTNFPEKDAQHIIWFDYGIYASIEHFNTDESRREPQDRCLNKRMYNKWITNVVVRQKIGPHHQVVPFEESLCVDMDTALQVAAKYINLHQQAAHDSQIEHMTTFKVNDLT